MLEPHQEASDPMPDIQQMLDEAQEWHKDGDFAQAEALYSRIAGLRPDDFIALHLLGVVKNQRGDYASAEEVLTKALAINPRSPLAHLNKGTALWHLERHQEALTHYQHSLRLNADNPEALLSCAVALSRLGRHTQALAQLDKFLARQPDSPEALLSRGIVLKDLHRPEEALESLEKALGFKPDLVEALMHRAEVLIAVDRPEDALADFERVLEIQPDHEEVRKRRGDPRLHSAINLNARLKNIHNPVSGEENLKKSKQDTTKKALLLLPQFITGEDGLCGEYPVESDIHYHFEKSLINLNYSVFKPSWNICSDRLLLDIESLLRILDENSFSCCIMEINYATSEKLASNVWYKKIEIIEKLKSRVENIITFVGDAYPRGGIIDVIQEAHDISTIVWCPYQGVKGMLHIYNRSDLVEKINTTPMLPTVFTESEYTAFPEKKAYEISYIGSAKRIRLKAVAEFCRLDNLNIFVNTTTRNYNSSNNSKPMKYFLDIMDNSVSTITSTARSPEPMPLRAQGIQAKFPEVFSGRFVEAISRGCMPIYIASDSQDYPPLPNLQEGIHYFRVEQVHDYIATLQAIRGLNRTTIIQALRDYHAAYLSPQAMFAPLLDQLVKNE